MTISQTCFMRNYGTKFECRRGSSSGCNSSKPYLIPLPWAIDHAALLRSNSSFIPLHWFITIIIVIWMFGHVRLLWQFINQIVTNALTFQFEAQTWKTVFIYLFTFWTNTAWGWWLSIILTRIMNPELVLQLKLLHVNFIHTRFFNFLTI